MAAFAGKEDEQRQRLASRKKASEAAVAQRRRGAPGDEGQAASRSGHQAIHPSKGIRHRRSGASSSS
ncbi:hypothetical protein [Oryza sativa Japonica Group]|uniref:Uncharacterized protein n=1 Tax=Oryza sativa subsp. japonica TaxID=39947 RepID=Q8LQ44_ORYSJ|nr:hypothetical protein [Oryza sativa Japonica Group]